MGIGEVHEGFWWENLREISGVILNGCSRNRMGEHGLTGLV
jgi:hypothetical protein